jgi:hypothetical protein
MGVTPACRPPSFRNKCASTRARPSGPPYDTTMVTTTAACAVTALGYGVYSHLEAQGHNTKLHCCVATHYQTPAQDGLVCCREVRDQQLGPHALQLDVQEGVWCSWRHEAVDRLATRLGRSCTPHKVCKAHPAVLNVESRQPAAAPAGVEEW